MRTKFILLLVAFGALALSSCNTVAGFGEDVQRMGEGVENSGEGRSW
jgi:predicted small secreted protein